MAITSETVKQLREKTGAGMMDCKKALEATDGDMNAAVDYLRKKGAAIAEKRSDRAANQGIVVSKLSDDAKKGIIIEVNCETDFVARGDDFVVFANTIADIIFKHTPADLDTLKTISYEGTKNVADALSDMMGKIGERIEIKKFSIVTAVNGFVESYIHMGSKIGVIVEMQGEFTPANKTLARDIAMQVAAMSPIVVSREEVSKELIDREMEIYRQQAKNEGKPEAIAEKISTGRLEKYYQEVVLLEQSFIKDAGKTVRDLVSPNISIRQFKRYQLG